MQKNCCPEPINISLDNNLELMKMERITFTICQSKKGKSLQENIVFNKRSPCRFSHIVRDKCVLQSVVLCVAHVEIHHDKCQVLYKSG